MAQMGHEGLECWMRATMLFWAMAAAVCFLWLKVAFPARTCWMEPSRSSLIESQAFGRSEGQRSWECSMRPNSPEASCKLKAASRSLSLTLVYLQEKIIKRKECINCCLWRSLQQEGMVSSQGFRKRGRAYAASWAASLSKTFRGFQS